MTTKPSLDKDAVIANGQAPMTRENELAKLAASSKSLGEFIDAATDLCLSEEDKAFLSKMSPRRRKRERSKAVDTLKAKGNPK
jgi:hypothetical protein